MSKFVKFAKNVWGISDIGKTADKVALEGIDALADFIKKIGLPTTLRELGIDDKDILPDIAASCNIAPGSYGDMNKKAIMEIIYRKLEELKKLENNPRTISDEQLDKLKESIRNNPDYFEARPIILSDRTGELIIIAGNQRYDACISLGMQQVPTVLIPNLTEERERELIIRDNVNNGQWDITKLFDWDCNELLNWGMEGISFPDPTDFSEDIEDSHNVLKNANYEAGAHIKYLVFEGYKIPVSESELEALKARASEYLDKNGVMVGFVNNLLGL